MKLILTHHNSLIFKPLYWPNYVIVLVLNLVFTTMLFGQEGIIDSTFAADGLYMGKNSLFTDSELDKVVVTSEGKIIFLGTTVINNKRKLWLSALLPNGELDTSFGNNGWVIIHCPNCYEGYTDMILYGNDKIIITSTIASGSSSQSLSDVRMWRLNDNGIVEGDFILDLLGRDMNIKLRKQSTGKFIATISTQTTIAIMRFDSLGAVDSTFGLNGLVFTDSIINPGYGIAIDEYDRILIGASQYANSNFSGVLYRYNSNGTLDANFGTNGKLVLPAIVFTGIGTLIDLPNGLFLGVGAGTINGYYSSKMICFFDDGFIDYSFGKQGQVKLSASYYGNILVQPDGKILISGSKQSNGGFIERYMSNGDLDSSFGFAGRSQYYYTWSRIEDFCLQPDGKIVAATDHLTSTSNPDTLDVIAARFHTGLSIGIPENSIFDADLALFPNPVKDKATLSLSLKERAVLDVRLLDGQGRLLKQLVNNQRFNKGKSSFELIGFSDVPSGIYFLLITSQHDEAVVKVIKGGQN